MLTLRNLALATDAAVLLAVVVAIHQGRPNGVGGRGNSNATALASEESDALDFGDDRLMLTVQDNPKISYKSEGWEMLPHAIGKYVYLMIVAERLKMIPIASDQMTDRLDDFLPMATRAINDFAAFAFPEHKRVASAFLESFDSYEALEERVRSRHGFSGERLLVLKDVPYGVEFWAKHLTSVRNFLKLHTGVLLHGKHYLNQLREEHSNGRNISFVALHMSEYVANCSDYFVKAVEYFRSRLSAEGRAPIFVATSDPRSPASCREALASTPDLFFVPQTCLGIKCHAAFDIAAQAQCEHFILSHGAQSVWTALLSPLALSPDSAKLSPCAVTKPQNPTFWPQVETPVNDPRFPGWTCID